MLNILKKAQTIDQKMTNLELQKVSIILNKISNNFFLIFSALIIIIVNLIINVLTITKKLKMKINNLTYLSLNLNLLCNLRVK